MAYGGDFGDVPNDYNFIMDGLLYSNHTPSSNMVEFAKSIEPVQTLAIDGNKITIINRYDFVGLEHLVCSWEIVADGGNIPGGEVALPKGKHSSFTHLLFPVKPILTTFRYQATYDGRHHR